MSIGIRIEHMDKARTGQWLAFSLQVQIRKMLELEDMPTVGLHHEHAVGQYSRPLKIVDNLLQMKYPPEPPEQRKFNKGLLAIRDVDLIGLSRECILPGLSQQWLNN